MNIEAIKAAALAATPGEWVQFPGLRFDPEVVITTKDRQDKSMNEICGMDVDFTGVIGLEQKANATHIVTANPTAVLEMCAEIERLTTEVNEQARLLGISAELELRMRADMRQALGALNCARVEYDDHGMPMDARDQNVELAAAALKEQLNHDSDKL